MLLNIDTDLVFVPLDKVWGGRFRVLNNRHQLREKQASHITSKSASRSRAVFPSVTVGGTIQSMTSHAIRLSTLVFDGE